MPGRLMIGYDGAGNSEDALALGAVLAPALAAQPLVVSVVPYLHHLISHRERAEMAEAEARRIGAAARARLPGLEVETRVLADDSPARALHELIETEQPLALVIGSAHRGAAGRVFVGDVGGALLSGAPCAVAVAPRGYAERPHNILLRIAVAINDSDESDAALASAVALAQKLSCSLAVFTVAEPVQYGFAVPFTVVDTRVLTDATRQRAERTLDQALERVPADLPVEHRLLTGDPADLIANAAVDVDLLIVGSRGYGPVRRALLGGVSAKLARAAACPLLVLPRRAGADPLRLDKLESAIASTPRRTVTT
jgi:nucleotide-binding universal stress UspA family protein